jgi:hypothetical protein
MLKFELLIYVIYILSFTLSNKIILSNTGSDKIFEFITAFPNQPILDKTSVLHKILISKIIWSSARIAGVVNQNVNQILQDLINLKKN